MSVYGRGFCVGQGYKRVRNRKHNRHVGVREKVGGGDRGEIVVM